MSAPGLLGLLVRVALEIAGLVLVVALATRLWRGMPPAARAALWWAVSLRALLAFVPWPRFALPEVAAPARPLVETIAAPIAIASGAITPRPDAEPSAWNVLLAIGVAIWTLGIAAGAVLALGRVLDLERRWRAADAFDADTDAEVRVGVIDAPVALAGRRPRILLPESCRALDARALALVLAHEAAHVRRGDLAWGWVPFLASLVLWFHPLLRLAAREYHAAREEACDAEALAVTGAPPRDYGALLLRFGVTRLAPIPGAVSAGTPHGRTLKRRIAMLAKEARPSGRARFASAALVGAVTAIAIVGFAPFRVATAGSPDLRDPAGGIHATKGGEFSWLVFEDGRKGSRGAGSERDLDLAHAIHERDGGDLVYMRFVEERWLFRDAATIAAVRRATAPEDAFADMGAPAQARLARLDREQAELEEAYASIRSRYAELERRHRKLAKEVDAREVEGRSTADLEDERDRLTADRDALTRELESLSRLRDTLRARSKDAIAFDEAAYRERERIHRSVAHAVAEIGRQARNEGRGERLP